jgi:hypothetical protein
MLLREEVEIIGHLRIEYTTYYEEDSYEVEGHGYHVITDVHDKNRKINAIYMCIDDYALDITHKLSKKEFDEFSEYLLSI